MTPSVLAVISFSSLLLHSTSAFEMKSFYPSSSNASAVEGSSVLLGCQSDAYMRSCTWRHRDKFCRLQYSRTARGLVKNACIVYKERIFVHGEYEMNECVIELRDVDQYDDGIWTCHIEEYVNKLNWLKKARRIQHQLQLHVLTHDKREEDEPREMFVSKTTTVQDSDDNHSINEATNHLVLAIGGTVVALAVLCSIVAGLIAVLKRVGVIDNPRADKRLSVALESHASVLDELEVHPDEVEANEKARAKLGLQISYNSSRRVL